jgi:hypothetical protein
MNPATWIILRCSGANTLRLAQSLAWASIEAWSPAVRFIDRVGENRTRRPQRIPLMASYVFVAAEHLHELLAIREAPMAAHPEFRFMRDPAGEISSCPDRQLNPLRVAEQKGQPVEQAHKWEKGDLVIYPGSGFEGLVGTVERANTKTAWVNFGLFNSKTTSEIPSVMLLPHQEQPVRRAA